MSLPNLPSSFSPFDFGGAIFSSGAAPVTVSDFGPAGVADGGACEGSRGVTGVGDATGDGSVVGVATGPGVGAGLGVGVGVGVGLGVGVGVGTGLSAA